MVNVKRPIVEGKAPAIMSLQAGTVALAHGVPVKVGTADGKLYVTAAATDAVIGTTVYDDLVIANLQSDNYAANSVVSVELFGIVKRGIAGGTITKGEFVRLGAGGKVVKEAAAGTKTVNTLGVALSSATSDTEVLYLKY